MFAVCLCLLAVSLHHVLCCCCDIGNSRQQRVVQLRKFGLVDRRMGASTDPCGTPEIIGVDEDFSLPGSLPVVGHFVSSTASIWPQSMRQFARSLTA